MEGDPGVAHIGQRQCRGVAARPGGIRRGAAETVLGRVPAGSQPEKNVEGGQRLRVNHLSHQADAREDGEGDISPALRGGDDQDTHLGRLGDAFRRAFVCLGHRRSCRWRHPARGADSGRRGQGRCCAHTRRGRQGRCCAHTRRRGQGRRRHGSHGEQRRRWVTFLQDARLGEAGARRFGGGRLGRAKDLRVQDRIRNVAQVQVKTRLERKGELQLLR